MERAIADRIDFRALQRQCRFECQPLIDEMVRIESSSIRLMYIRPGSMQIEYGPYPPKIQAHLDQLNKWYGEIVARYRKLAGLEG